RARGSQQPLAMNDAVDPALVAPSRHCLYIRGLPSRIKADEVRRYFIDKEADCSIDFFSYTGSQAALNIALRFDSHEVAKQIMRRYNESGLLGCKVSIVWFKDMIRARQRVRADPQLRARVQRAQEGRGLSGSRSPPPAPGWRFGQQNRSRSGSQRRRSRSRSPTSRSRSPSRSSSTRSAARRGPRSPPEEDEEAAATSASAANNGIDNSNGGVEPRRLGPRSPPSPPPVSSPPPPPPPSPPPPTTSARPSTSSLATPLQPPSLPQMSQPPFCDADNHGVSADAGDGILRLVRAKKAELERAYRQDCDTFAVVAKVLVSKNSSLEGPVRDALREALRDIGQHCVEELREFARTLAIAQQQRQPAGQR
ncbi:hypothetical protein BOX15_Mlig022724g1, partial [Macrostomum lignano]